MRFIRYTAELACLAMFFLTIIAGLALIVQPVGVA